jgi:hypothetical protein
MKADTSQLIAQRNRATACAVLVVVISLALVMNNFRAYRKDLVDAHNEIIQLQYELIKTQNALKENEAGLLRLQRALILSQEEASHKRPSSK